MNKDLEGFGDILEEMIAKLNLIVHGWSLVRA